MFIVMKLVADGRVNRVENIEIPEGTTMKAYYCNEKTSRRDRSSSNGKVPAKILLGNSYVMCDIWGTGFQKLSVM